MVEITIVKLMDSIPFREDLLSYVGEYRRNKISRYKNEQDCKRSLLAELLIKKAIIEKMGLRDVTISRNKYGKPYLQGVKDFHFNISHSGHYVVIAVSEGKVGIDIEKKDKVDYRIAERFFGNKEAREILASSEEDERIDAFYRIWTLKESYVKAIGKGLTIPFSSFEFTFGNKIEIEDPEQREIFHFFNTSINDYSLSVCYAEQDFNKIMKCMCEKQLCDDMKNIMK